MCGSQVGGCPGKIIGTDSLKHVRQSSGRVGQSLAYVLSLDFYRWQFNPLGSIRQSEQNHAYLICYPQGAVGCTLDKHGL